MAHAPLATTAANWQRALPPDRRLVLLRVIITLNVLLAVNYILWRHSGTVDWNHWYIGVPLLIAETYSVIDTLMYSLTMWRCRQRPEPPVAPPGLTVDVFITCYNEPPELVRYTVNRAVAMTYPHRTWVLDDGNSEAMRAVAIEEGAGYIIRSEDWAGRTRHAKAGNLNNALMETHGEFILVLDADQIPLPHLLDRVLGYFDDPSIAFVQTPQYFYNVPASDPMGAQAPLFYGPLLQGKDGWNAAFFCGSNAVLRREALMQLGLRRYVIELTQRVRRGLATADRALGRARKQVEAGPHESRMEMLTAIEDLTRIVKTARAAMAEGRPIQEVTGRFQAETRRVSRGLVRGHLGQVRRDLAGMFPNATGDDDQFEATLNALSTRTMSPLAALEDIRTLLLTLDVDHASEAQAVMPMSTISVTEDMATAMRLHGMGWRSVYHHEVLAEGLAPDDLRSTLQQRLRWAQGTLQVFFRENPLLQRGLALPQRVMYLATMWSYFSGFATVVYLAAPCLYLFFGFKPVTAYSLPFFARLIPFLIVNQILFTVSAPRIKKWRGHQYSLSLFPLWITAVISTIRNVYFGQPLPFVVTPKTRQGVTGQWRLVRVQIATIVILAAAGIWGAARLATGTAPNIPGTMVNVLWAGYDVFSLSVVWMALRYRPSNESEPPARLLGR